jgi:N-formylglutamate amidohydrolase
MPDVKDELDPPFEILEPAECRGPFVFNSPHSGSVYPSAFLSASRLDTTTLRRSEDSFVDELILGVVRRGHPLMRAHFPRCYVDVNREPYELDPRMFDGRLPSFANTRSMRVAGGLGTVARVVGDAQEIYGERIPVDDALRRIEALYKPYHRALRRLMTRVHRAFGVAVLVDCHSMPSAVGSRDERPRSDVVLGDRYGTSCTAIIADTIETSLRSLGYSVSRNKPYAGGFITEHYGNPAAGLHAIQLELNRALYMDERRYARTGSFGRVARDMETLAARMAEIPLEELRPYRAAAE